jgi:ABC-2 type transport system ATP-binding protein
LKDVETPREHGRLFAVLPPPNFSVVARGLRKAFGTAVAVSNVSLAVPRGSIYGLVGPNGAGKTTTIKMLIGLCRPDAGDVLIGGVATWPDPTNVKRKLGVVPDGMSLFERLTGFEHIQYAGLLRGLDDAEARRRATEALQVLGLTDSAGKLVVDYSHGMRKKVALASALIHRPEVLILDEPFEGVDPVSAVTIRDVLEQYRAGGGTAIMSSHSMDTVERLCDHLAVISGGVVVAEGSVGDLTANGVRLEDVFVQLVGGATDKGDLSWLRQ